MPDPVRAALRQLAGPVFEWELTSADGRPLAEAPRLRATSPSGRPLAADAFRDGERWLARLWLDEPGQWRWTAPGEGSTGTVERPSVASAWPASALRTSADRRHLEQADGRPVFYLGDTAWFIAFKGAPDQWQRYLDRRAELGYNVLQMHLLPFAWGVPDPEGNHPFVDDDVARPSPAYFARIDRLCAMAAERGLYTCMCLMWGGNRPGMPAGHFTTEQAVAFARYAIARYAAFPMIWSLSGDAPYVEDLDKWEAVGAAVEAADPYRHPTTNHLPPSMNWRFLHHDSPWHDFHMLQTGHRRQTGRLDIAALPAAYRAREPSKPVVNGEPWYEAHPEMDDYRATGRYGAPFTAEDARYAFWVSVLSGATMGHGYGGQGLWNWKRPGDDETHLGGPQIGPTWAEALDHAGGAQCGLGARVLRALPWWRLRPCPERAELDPLESDPRWRPACAVAPGEAWLTYLPRAQGQVTLKGLAPWPWRARWVDPRTGQPRPIGPAQPGLDLAWRAPPAPSTEDWLLLLVR
jgi:hypothetical protein